MQRRLKHWGWGYEDEQPSPQELRDAAAFLTDRLGFGSKEPEQPVALEDVELPAPRLEPPASLAAICSVDRYDRALHAYGRAYRDVVRAFRGSFEHPPDVVAHPRDEAEVEAVLDWAVSSGAAAIPFGGGTSVVGGVEAGGPAGLRGGRHDRPQGDSTACSTSTRSRARRGSRAGRSARSSSASSPSTA